MVVNTLTVVMDALVVVLVLALTRPWDRRLPSWLLAVPLWIACGLLGPLLVAFPAQILYAALAPGAEPAGRPGSSGENELLAGRVSNTVYTGFVLQALALGALFVLYARERWGICCVVPSSPAPGPPFPCLRRTRRGLRTRAGNRGRPPRTSRDSSPPAGADPVAGGAYARALAGGSERKGLPLPHG